MSLWDGGLRYSNLLPWKLYCSIAFFIVLELSHLWHLAPSFEHFICSTCRMTWKVMFAGMFTAFFIDRIGNIGKQSSVTEMHWGLTRTTLRFYEICHFYRLACRSNCLNSNWMIVIFFFSICILRQYLIFVFFLLPHTLFFWKERENLHLFGQNFVLF